MKLFYKLVRNSKPMPKNLSHLMSDIADYLVSSTQRKIKNGILPPNAPLTKAVKQGSNTLQDSGILSSSITGGNTQTTAEVGTNLKYARIQHEGGTITPKSADALYIPASASTRTLMRTYGLTPGKCMSAMKKAGYQIWRSKSGKAMLAKEGKDGDPFVLFIRKESIEIPARPFLFVDDTDRKIIALKTENFIKGK